MTDTHLALDLAIYIINDATLYERRTKPIIRNLGVKMARGIYDHGKAGLAFAPLVAEGARQYHGEFGVKIGRAERLMAAAELLAHYASEIDEAAEG